MRVELCIFLYLTFFVLITDQIRQVLKVDEQVYKLSQEIYKQKSLLVMGRGYNFATCLEGALKVGALNRFYMIICKF